MNKKRKKQGRKRKIEKEITGIKKHTSSVLHSPAFAPATRVVVIVLVLVLGVVGKENKIVRYSDNNDDDDKDGAEVAWMSGRVVDRLEM